MHSYTRYVELDLEVTGEEIAELFKTGGTHPLLKSDMDPGLETEDQGLNLQGRTRYELEDVSSGTDSEDDNICLIRSVLKPQESHPLPQHVPHKDEDEDAETQKDGLSESEEH